MIEKQIQKVEINQIIESQIPNFLLSEENDGFVQLLKQYYISQEFQGSSVDIVENIPEYKNPDIFNNEDLIESTNLTSAIDEFDDEIIVTSTLGWPSRYGLLKIDDEIITYTSKTETKFLGCIRGFSGIDQYQRRTQISSLVFSTSSASSHVTNSTVVNLSNLFLKELLFKSKSQYAPGFENLTLADGLDQTVFLKRVVDFYRSKGTDDAFKVLFKILYGKNVKVIKPQEYIIKPSDAEYLTSQALLVEFIEGEDLLELETLSIVQNRDDKLNLFESIASISSVETLELNSTRLYKLVLDSSTISGQFEVTGRTKTTEFVNINSDTINVDSTIGFPESGTFDYFDSFGDKITISYTSKTVNQFLGCTGVVYSIPEKTTLNYGSYAFIENPFTGVITTVKLLKVLNNIENYDTKYFSSGDYITIKSFGEYYDNNNPRLNTWISNVRATFNVSNIEKQSTMYKITLLDTHDFLLGDEFELYSSLTNSVVNRFTITQVIDEKTFLGNFGDFNLDTSKQYYIKKVLQKVISDTYPSLTKLNGNILNVYSNVSDVYVASNSLPAYTNNKVKISASKNTLTFTTIDNTLTRTNPHIFYTGESVQVTFSSNTSLNGKYYIKVIDQLSLKLSKSRSDIFFGTYIEFDSNQTCTVTLSSLADKNLSAQSLMRKIPKVPTKSKEIQKTLPNTPVGIFVNGVEILSYKGTDFLTYGPLESLKVLNPGNGYDVFNPPEIIVEDNFSGSGIGAEVIPHLEGSLSRVDILNPGFDLLEPPVITVSGGNGTGAVVSAKTKLVEYSIECNANVGVNTISSFVTFPSEHKFKTGEEVFYLNLGTSAIGVGTTSLINGSRYFVNRISSTQIKLYNNKTDSLVDVNHIIFNQPGNGLHKFQSVQNKTILSSVIVENSGSGYKNSPITFESNSVNIFNSTLSYSNHNFNTGDKVVYSTTGSPIGGISTSTTYYVIKINDDAFRLASSLNNSNNGTYIQLSSVGTGYHTFNYEPISITVKSRNGFDNPSYDPVLRPIFLGKIYNAVLKNKGSNYGSSDILNFEANPIVRIKEAVSAELRPIVVNGKIKEVLIENSGSDYSSPPNITFHGNGSGAKAISILNNFGGISSVIIESEGNGYDEKTTILVQENGSSLVIESKVKKWNFDVFNKIKNTLVDDDGIVYKSSSENSSLQFYSLSTPRELRKTLFTKRTDNTKNYSLTDYENDFSAIKFHSPILGWAYDGCPIYGQYAYDRETGGDIRKLKSGYSLKKTRNDGPSIVDYPIGTFIEDYEYTASGDLDEHNGRFCITPEYPNGVYAYFATNTEFPYVIGDSFSNAVEISNLYPSTYKLNQNIDFETLKLKRYTYTHKISENNSKYDYFISPKESLKFPVKIKNAQNGKIESFKIISAGQNYSVGDKIVNNVDNEYIGEITEVVGPDITSIATTSISFPDCPIFYDSTNGKITIFTQTQHQFNNLDYVSFSGISTTSFESLNGFKQIGVSSITTQLSTGIGTTGSTGLSTFISLNNLSFINEDSILEINEEKLLVLNLYKDYNTIRVYRDYTNENKGDSYAPGTPVKLLPTSISVFSGISTSYQTKVNIKKYFDPQYSIGISSVGTATTITVFTGIAYTTKDLQPKSIYIPNHGYTTGQRLTYSHGNGSSILVSKNGIDTFTLSDNQYIYVAKYNNDEIGISTTPVGLGSTGFIGIGTSLNLLYFNGYGTGFNHSFNTSFEEVKVNVEKNVSTLTTKYNYENTSLINLSVLPNTSTYIKLVYDDQSRRILINPKNISSVNILTNEFYIENNNYKTGDKVLYRTTGTAIGGLVNNASYYVIRRDNDHFKLVETFSEINKAIPDYVNIVSSGSGTHTLSLINPKIDIIKGNTVLFDTSDSSLSEVISGVQTSVFTFDLYTDPLFRNRYEDINLINKTGLVGIGTSSSDSNVTLSTNETSPSILYYGFNAANTNNSSTTKNTFIIDNDVKESFKISITDSAYNGQYSISGISSNKFNINLKSYPEKLSYDETNCILKYTTNDLSSAGKINNVRVTSTKTYNYPVTNLNIITNTGSGAILLTNSENIGKISDISELMITSELPSDPTLTPTVNFPQVLRVDESSSLSYIGVSSGGRKYSYAPDLILIDTATNSVITDVSLRANLSGTSVGSVDILLNTNSLYSSNPRVVSINNSNGIGINTISYDNSTKIVRVSLAASFSVASDYPFRLGERVFVENIGIVSTTDVGYDSSAFNYQTFEVVGVNTNLGGAKPTVSYKLPDTASNVNVGILTCILGRIIPEVDLPQFNPVSKINSFSSDEIILSSNNKIGKNVSWNSNSKILKINSSDEFTVGEIIFGKTSGTKARIIEKLSFESDYSVGALTKPFKFFNKETGKVSEYFQRFEDGDYNQLFSYSLKSTIPFETWKNSVLSLAHVSGYKPFADLDIIGIGSSQSKIILNEVKSTVNLYNEISFHDVTDYDYAFENNLIVNDHLYSNEITFNSRLLTDYIQSKTNRALILDDISSQFNSNPRVEKYSNISEFNFPNEPFIKTFVFVRDTLRTNDKALYQLILLNDDPNFEQITYASNWSSYDLGYFDIQKTSGSTISVQFYPYNFDYNSYNVTSLSIPLYKDVQSGITTQSLGTIGAIEVTPRVSIASTTSPIANQIVAFSTSKYTSSKALVLVQSNTGLIQSNELTIIQNGSDIIVSEYAEMLSDEEVYGNPGLGTYSAEISGGNVILSFTPKSGIGVTVFAQLTSISSNTGVGTTNIGAAYIDSNYVSIASTSSPTFNVVTGYATSEYSASYILAEVKDLTNNQVQFSEIVLVNNNTQTYIEEYNVSYTDSPIGEFSSEISGAVCNLKFKPPENINVEVRTIKYVTSERSSTGVVSFTNAEINYQYSRYTGTIADVKNAFNLTHNTFPVFYKEFDGSNAGIVSITNNALNIPSHYFSNGEKLTYSYDGSPIGIATTSITGIGTTDKLPSTVYVIKIDENKIRFAASPQNALSTPAVPLVFTNVGVGTLHSLNPEKQNTKLLITIDNITQSPLVKSDVSYTTTEEFSDLTSLVKLTGIDNISSGDILKIDNEYLKVVNIGIATTNGVVVNRGIFDTSIVTHNTGSTVTKYNGSYVVIKNTLYFVDPPYGKIGVNTDQASTFHGRVFLRTGQPGSATTAYTENYLFDDISSNFTGIGKTFTIKSDGNNIIGISTNNGVVLINNIPQVGGTNQNYILSEVGGTSTNIEFNGNPYVQSYDVNTTQIPRNGVIREFSTNSGFGLQPLIGAGATCTISIGGTISSVSIGNSGSGYRVGIQTTVYVRAVDRVTGLTTNVGFASISSGSVSSITITNPGSGFTSSNPPVIEIDKPLIYENLPLLGGSGTGARVSIVVGQGSSVIDFNITNYGYGYKEGEKLYLETGGTTGIQTVPTAGIGFTSFSLVVDSLYSDKFAGWTFGELQTLDDLTPLVDGVRKTFTLTLNNQVVDLRTKDDSLINIDANIIVIRNGIIQIPRESYIFNGGSRLVFTEAPLVGDKIQVLFYKGSLFDSEFVDIEETVKIGDKVQLLDDFYPQDERLVKDIISSDLIETNYYSGLGITTDVDYRRILTWKKQREDLIIDGQQISKSRSINNSKLYPVSNIIKPISIGSTEIFVESAQPLFEDFDDLSESDFNVMILNSSAGIGTTGYSDYEKINSVKVSGDFGILSGVTTAIVGSGLTALVFDFVIPSSSALRNISIVGSATTISGISTGYYFVLSDTNVGNGVTSISSTGSIVGVGTSFIDGVYEVYSTNITTGSAFGFGTTSFLRVTSLVTSFSGITTITNDYCGRFSWGRLYDFNGTTSKSFTTNSLNGLIGLSTSPSVIRTKQIRTPY